jgi:cytidylate kinase
MPGVTISAGYGAGGSMIAPALAERLGLPMLDRAISSHVAAQLRVSVEEAQGGVIKRSAAGRFLAVLAPLAGGVLGAGTDCAPPEAVLPLDEAGIFREQAEAIMRQALVTGAVILGRAGGTAFRHESGVLRVRLFGPPEARIVQAARIEVVDEDTARQRLPEVDRARAQYVRRLYGSDIDDPELYHLQIDSTVLSLETCVDIIANAYRSHIAARVDQAAAQADHAEPLADHAGT